ncbi:MAG: precorrin-6A synthase (deacetylating) [Paracoccaceae bacterium]
MNVIKDLWLVGVGTGSLAHITQEGAQALRDANAILMPQKGTGKDDLAEIRTRILADCGATGTVIPFEYPVRDPDLPYLDRVDHWHDQIAARWMDALTKTDVDGPVALLVWGDPSLYDSTMRIAQRLSPRPNIRVVPGITALQALTAAHAIPLNTVNGPVTITTGRRLRHEGWPTGAETVAVMLDGKSSFQSLKDDNLHIWWGAFLGMPEQILDSGPLADTAARIVDTRKAAREQHGWIMDTYLLRRI